MAIIRRVVLKTGRGLEREAGASPRPGCGALTLAASCDAVNHFDFIFAMLQDSETTQQGLVNFAAPRRIPAIACVTVAR